MKKLITMIATFAFLLIFAGISFAADAVAAPKSEPNALTQVTQLVIQLLMVIVPLAVLWLSRKAVGLFESKTKIDVPASIEAQIDAWVTKGIAYAEEKSYQKIKEQTAKLTGPEKLETAAKFVLDMAETQGWTQWTADKIKAKIEAAIGEGR